MRNTILLAAILSTASFAASATDHISYNTVEAGWTQLKLKNIDGNKGDGGYIRGSWGFSENFSVFGAYSQASDSQRYSDIYFSDSIRLRQQEFEVGVGYNYAFSDKAHLTADISYIRYNLKENYNYYNHSRNTSGYYWVEAKLNSARATVGIRAKPISRIELWAKAGYQYIDTTVDGYDFSNVIDSSVVGTVGGQVFFTNNFSFVAEGTFSKDYNQYKAGLRYTF